MSASLTNILPASTQSLPRLLKPSTRPIPLLSDPVAKTYSYAHTAWLLFYYYLRSSTLVAEPLDTLTLDVLPLAVGQCMFCVVCLPSSGNWFSGTNAGKIIEGTATTGSNKTARFTNLSGSGSLRKRVGGSALKSPSKSATADPSRESGSSWASRILPVLFSLVLALVVPPAPMFLLALVLGAPLYPTSLLPHTMALSVHVSLLALLPIFYTHGVSGAAWRDVAAAWLPFDEAGVWGGSVGTMIGGWIGAIPMALDWDREWQKWPCTVVWGAVLGWGVGRFLTNVLRLGIGKRINLSENQSMSMLTGSAQATTTSIDEKKTG